MAEFRMPSLGADMEAGTLVEWLKKPGDHVTRGDIVAVVETQKGAIEIEIFEDGTIERLLVDPGMKVPVGTPLAFVHGAHDVAGPAPVTAPVAPSPAAPPVTPAARCAARLRVSPAARRLAGLRGIDLSRLIGTGPEGAVISTDVERAGGAPASAPAAPARTKGIDRGAMRKAIAASMTRSKREIPHYYLSHAIDLSRALAWLEETNATRLPAERLLLAVLLLKAVALALHERPELNGFYLDDRFRPSARIHIGTAVAIRGGGLTAPAIHDVDRLSLSELMDRLRDLVARTRAGALRSSELADSTITVTSLGERGVDGLLGIIYPPQVAIVGFGTPALRPWVVGARVEPRRVVTASLAADHRVSDGHLGALFLAHVDRLLQQPEAL